MMMAKYSGGNSALTSNGLILFYYACALLSLVTGFSFIVAVIGVLISRSMAYKENASLAIAHCSWIFRSLWVAFLLLILAVFSTLYLIGLLYGKFPDTSSITNFNELWANPAMREALIYLLSCIGIGSIIVIWFVYRMVRGAYMLISSRPPVDSI